MKVRACGWLGAGLLVLCGVLAVEAAPRQVLLLNSFGREAAPFRAAAAACRSTLARELGEPVEFFEVWLDQGRRGDAEIEGATATYLASSLARRPVDLVVSVGAPAIRFAARRRGELFPDAPMVFTGAEPRTVGSELLGTNATMVAQRLDLPGMVENVLQLRPDTTQVVVVLGASPLERFWLAECRREFAAFTNRLAFVYLEDRTLAEMERTVASLPPRSFIIYGLLIMDGAGEPYDGDEGLKRLGRVANAPIYAPFRSQFGAGVVGGRMYDDERVGVEAGRVGIRLLRGERPESIPPRVLEGSAAVYDWRALRRWGISEKRLPPGSVVEHRQPSVWSRYRWQIVGAASFVVAQSGLIVGLLVARARRRETEEAAALIADASTKFIHLPAGEIDRHLEEAQRVVCAALGLGMSSLWQWRPDQPQTLTLTHLYRPLGGPPVPREMDGPEYFPWTQRQIMAGRTVMFSSPGELPPEAARDREVNVHYGIKATLAIPLAAGGGPVFGCLSFNDLKEERRWSAAAVRRLHMVAQIFANALARKRAEQALRESEARSGLAAEAAGAGLWRLDLGSGRYWLTAKTRELFGFPAEEVVTFERFLRLVHPDDQPRIRQAVDAVVAARGEGQVEYRVIRPDRGLRWMHSRGRVQEDACGQPEWLMGVSLDITEQRRAEQEIQDLRARLAHFGRVSLLGQLASALAHQLSQPLGAILRNVEAAEMLLQASAPDLGELQAIVTDIHHDNRRAGEVIDRLRSLLKRQTLDPRPLGLEGVMAEVLSLLQADAAARQVSIECHVSAGLPAVWGDRVHLQQVLLNLLVNAMDALAAGGTGDRAICIEARAGEAGWVEVRIADRGPGLPGGGAGGLFEPFFTTKPNGMGMGLAVSRTIIEAHRGRIWAENRPGGGACFCFTLPAVGADEAGGDR